MFQEWQISHDTNLLQELQGYEDWFVDILDKQIQPKYPSIYEYIGTLYNDMQTQLPTSTVTQPEAHAVMPCPDCGRTVKDDP